jgi:hypothetical protein
VVVEAIRWLADIGKEKSPPVRRLNVAGPSKRQLTAAIGDGERDRFLEATRAIIIRLCAN